MKEHMHAEKDWTVEHGRSVPVRELMGVHWSSVSVTQTTLQTYLTSLGRPHYLSDMPEERGLRIRDPCNELRGPNFTWQRGEYFLPGFESGYFRDYESSCGLESSQPPTAPCIMRNPLLSSVIIEGLF